MDNKLFESWCRQAAGQIRYPPDRRMVHDELMAHLADHRDALMEAGMAEEEATQKALEAMGSSAEIAPQLAAIHRPFWGYFYRMSKALAFAVCAMVLFLTLAQVLSTAFYFIQRNDGSFEIPYGPMDTYCFVNQDVSDSSDGYRFSVSRSAYWRDQGQYGLRFRLEYIDTRFFIRSCDAIGYFWAVDSLGNYYQSNNEGKYTGQPRLMINSYHGIGFVGSYMIQVFPMPNEEIEWLELHYDRDGRDIVLRIDLSGGAGS